MAAVLERRRRARGVCGRARVAVDDHPPGLAVGAQHREVEAGIVVAADGEMRIVGVLRSRSHDVASHPAHRRWTSDRDVWLVIHWLVPSAAAMRPSSVAANL
jgi:hypothetical protein